MAGLVMLAPAALAQRPYIGMTYPAGGQQGTTFQVKIGGQSMEGVHGVLVSGSGVTGRIVEYIRPIGPIEVGLLGQQLRDLRKPRAVVASATMISTAPTTSGDTMMMSSAEAAAKATATESEETAKMIAKLERRIREYQNFPANPALRGIVFVEITIAPDAPPGPRELRLLTLRGGASNPMPFHVGQLPEYCRKPMLCANKSVLGKEDLALRRRPENEVEDRITIPCTVNGQVAYGEINRYRFEARKGQRLVINTLARQLIPYIADAVPGWFQPVIYLYDSNGKELAYDDDYRFKPDPVIIREIPEDGEYVLAITDAIYRGREDFVYRITLGEVPFITSIFPLGGRVGEPHSVRMNGLHLGDAELTPPSQEAGAGIHLIAANKDGFLSNLVPFALDTLPEAFDKEPNNAEARAQKVTLPVIVNGRIDKQDDWDVFQFKGQEGETVVVEAHARRLDSPVDSVIKLTDAKGQLLAFNDDREDLGAGVNTHHADSSLMATLPADGTYCVHIGDTGRKGGEEYGYRLRISAPQPDFALRLVPSSATVRAKGSASIGVYALRKDGFNGPIKISLKDPPAGITAYPVTLASSQTITRISFRADIVTTGGPVNLTVIGSAQIGDKEIVRPAVPAEDQMQAFLWRHLVPAQDLKVFVFDPSYEPPPGRIAPELSPMHVARAKAVTAEAVAAGRRITKNQVIGRVRQLKVFYEDGLLTREFYCDRVAECGDPQ
jgi:hypothetical protein